MPQMQKVYLSVYDRIYDIIDEVKTEYNCNTGWTFLGNISSSSDVQVITLKTLRALKCHDLRNSNKKKEIIA